MRSFRDLVLVLFLLAFLVVACGEAATGLTAQQTWERFIKAMAEGNLLTVQSMCADDIFRRFNRDRLAYAGLVNAHMTSKVNEVKVVAQDKKTARLEVVYKVSPDAAWSQTFIVLLEKPKKNWKVTAIEGDTAMHLPGF